MSLTLTVLSFKGQPIREIQAVTIGQEGGTIGRSNDNTLILPDTEKFVSRHHASIKMENGFYYLSDTSLGGVFINGAESVLHNETIRLEQGMSLRIGEYDIAIAITEETAIDDFPFPINTPPVISSHNDFLSSVNEPWVETEELVNNPLMTDNFPTHEELVHRETTPSSRFDSQLNNPSPLFDSYIAPNISSTPNQTSAIPESFNFDDLFAETENTQPTKHQTNTNEFEDFFSTLVETAVTNPEPVIEPVSTTSIAEINSVELSEEIIETDTNSLFCEPTTAPLDEIEESSTVAPIQVMSSVSGAEEITEISSDTDSVTETSLLFEFSNESSSFEETTESFTAATENITEVSPLVEPVKTEPLLTEPVFEKVVPTIAAQVLFEAFLQGAAITDAEIPTEQQAETLNRIGQMFRKLIDGTVAVLRSRAEFKSLCRVSMTVIKAADNNPLKFTVSTDDVLRQLVENNKGGFLNSTVAIEEAFNDIMNHQLAMQAGIQASLTELLKTFDPKIIEKQFEQGLVLQKKAKCWESYEKIYANTVEDAVENFFGDEFVRAYEQQMSVLKKARK